MRIIGKKSYIFWVKFILFSFFITLILFGDTIKEKTLAIFLNDWVDAYINVSVFVGITLLVFYCLEHFFKIDTPALLKKHHRWQVPIASLLGTLPGCGGAIVVISQYTKGGVGFGSVVAVLISTMGDAAFLLLAQRPDWAIIVFTISIITGILSGWLIDFIHGPDYLKIKDKVMVKSPKVFTYPSSLVFLWFVAFVPGLFLGILNLFQIDIDPWLGIKLSFYVGIFGSSLSVLIWLIFPYISASFSSYGGGGKNLISSRVIMDTSFVSVWILLSFISFSLTQHWGNLDITILFSGLQIYMPLMACLVGFIPGCGPQIIVTTLFLNNYIPFSALISNAISNDGDALFPAIAFSPKVAILATLYSAIPALLLGYGYLFIFES